MTSLSAVRPDDRFAQPDVAELTIALATLRIPSNRLSVAAGGEEQRRLCATIARLRLSASGREIRPAEAHRDCWIGLTAVTRAWLVAPATDGPACSATFDRAEHLQRATAGSKHRMLGNGDIRGSRRHRGQICLRARAGATAGADS